jgi:hypothetical protein
VFSQAPSSDGVVEKSAWLEKHFSSSRGSPATLAARCRRLRRRQGTPPCGFQPSRSSRRGELEAWLPVFTSLLVHEALPPLCALPSRTPMH